jgi:hypothetical protein
MGGHYGSVQVRSDDRERVKSIAIEVARAKGIRCLIGPALKGWVGIYPENNGQDESVGREIAEQVGADVLHVLVHDDDVLAYWLWRDGKEVASYWSKPGYFGDENLDREERMAGAPGQFAPFIGEKNVARLAALLQRSDSPVFESERLESLGKLLGIANLVSAYEYLKEGEASGVKGRRQFEEIPDDGEAAREKQERQEQRRRAAAAKRALLKSGTLLLSEAGRWITACAAGDRFLVSWYPVNQRAELLAYEAPWKTSQPVSVNEFPYISDIASTPDGRFVAGVGERRITVWESKQEALVTAAEIELETRTALVAISIDGRRVAHATRDGIALRDLEAGGRLYISLPMPAALAFHPDGAYLLSCGPTIGIVRCDARLGGAVVAPPLLQIHVGGKNPVSEKLAARVSDRFGQFDVEQVLRQRKSSLEKVMEMGRAAKGPLGKKNLSAEQLNEIERQMYEGLERERASLLAANAAGNRVPIQPMETVYCAGWSGDGRWLWCGTNRGVRVFEWDAILTRSGDAPPPPPRWRVDLPATMPNVPLTGVTAAAVEPSGERLVFAATDGRLSQLRFTDGQVEHFTHGPPVSRVFKLLFTADASSLGMVRQDHPGVATSGQKTFWEIWSYPKVAGRRMSIS